MKKNGDVYEGEWVNDKQEGQGTMTYKQLGNVYDGEWKDGQRNGKGKMTYKGLWEFDDQVDGCYTLIRIAENDKDHDVYEGEWKNGKKHGKGKMKYICFEGECDYLYDGNWKNDEWFGLGTVTELVNNKEFFKFEGKWTGTRKGKAKLIEGDYWHEHVFAFKQFQGEGKWINFDEGYNEDQYSIEHSMFDFLGKCKFVTADKETNLLVQFLKDGRVTVPWSTRMVFMKSLPGILVGVNHTKAR